MLVFSRLWYIWFSTQLTSLDSAAFERRKIQIFENGRIEQANFVLAVEIIFKLWPWLSYEFRHHLKNFYVWIKDMS